ncbi:hypothetical protein OFM15_29690, partial [Escherichia coli]|nr:hypothetical protein [Escherichia coli]
KVLEVFTIGKFLTNGLFYQQRCFICPAPGNISDGVTTTSQHPERDIETLDIFNTCPMSSNAEIEAA